MKQIELFQKRTWAEINLEALKFNFQQIKKQIGKTRICCVIKANAYGHGAVQLYMLEYVLWCIIEKTMKKRYNWRKNKWKENHYYIKYVS